MDFAVILTNVTEFSRKIQTIKLQQYFPNYSGMVGILWRRNKKGNNEHYAIHFIRKLFLELTNKAIQIYELDVENIDVVQQIWEQNERATTIMFD